MTLGFPLIIDKERGFGPKDVNTSQQGTAAVHLEQARPGDGPMITWAGWAWKGFTITEHPCNLEHWFLRTTRDHVVSLIMRKWISGGALRMLGAGTPPGPRVLVKSDASTDDSLDPHPWKSLLPPLGPPSRWIGDPSALFRLPSLRHRLFFNHVYVEFSDIHKRADLHLLKDESASQLCAHP